jgi:hypothetical protein
MFLDVIIGAYETYLARHRDLMPRLGEPVQAYCVVVEEFLAFVLSNTKAL